MGPSRVLRRMLALAAGLALVAGCTSAIESTTSAPAPSSTEASPQVPSSRVTLRPSPDGGSFLVRAVYPKSPSNCKHTQRGKLEARYPGRLAVRSADDGTLSLTLTLPFERYLEGIAEVPPSWPAAALDAQVIAARSYALARIGWTGQQGETLQTPICATSDCQVYGGIPVPPTPDILRWDAAVQRTRGKVLLYDDRPADTVYFSTSNGHTYGNDQVFGSAPLPYLRPVIERDDGASPTSRWRVPLPFRDLARFLHAGGLWPDRTRITSVTSIGSERAGHRRRHVEFHRCRGVPRHGQRVGLVPDARPISDRRLAHGDPVGLVRRVIRSIRRDGDRPRLGPRRGHGAVGRVREGEEGMVRRSHPGLLLRRPSAHPLPRAGTDPCGRGLRSSDAQGQALRTGRNDRR